MKWLDFVEQEKEMKKKENMCVYAKVETIGRLSNSLSLFTVKAYLLVK